MLLNDFFTINETVRSETEIWAELLINSNHIIFEGHFPNQPVVPGVCMETTTTDIVVRMVEAGLGVAIVPLLPSGVVTKERKVTVRAIADPIRPIHSGVLTRRGDRLSAASREFIAFVHGKRATQTRGG